MNSSPAQSDQTFRPALWPVTVLVAMAGLAGCQLVPEMPDVIPEPPDHMVEVELPTPDPQVELEYHILAGEMAVQRGHRATAAREYVAALEYTRDPELAQRAARIALFAGEPDLALKAARAWVEASPDSLDAHKTTARLALRAGEQAVLAANVRRIIELHPDGPAAGLRDLPEVLVGEDGRQDVALNVLRDVVERYAEEPEAHYVHGVVALRYDEIDEAGSAAARALALRPDWPDAVLLRAGVLVQQGQVEAAEKRVAALSGSRTDRAEHHLALARQLLDADEIEAAIRQFERVLSLDPSQSDARYGLGLLALSLEDMARARTAFERLYRSGSRKDDAAYYLGNIAAADENYEQARRWYERVSGGSHLFEARLRSARALYHDGDLVAARAEMALLRKRLPELSDRIFMAEGEMLLDANDYDEAEAVYDQALSKAPDDADLLYGRSLVRERQGEIDSAIADLRTILANDPDSPRALNALGYLLSNHTDRYQEALGYIERALEAEPDDPAVIDSMGWIQYRMGDLESARAYLERAYSELNDPEVAAHLGEVLWKMGETAEAERIWRESLLENPDHPVLNETIQRLTR
ncbi:MAG: hypothetical protein CMN28_01485 [Salinisphaeraceae bacterium]|nr:hypothetical protein [Salinisphaeraceae bacterium]